MPFAYAVPLSTFSDLFGAVDPNRHHELTERLRAEIHADLARRLIGPDISTPTGWARTHYESVIAHGDIIFYGLNDFEEAAAASGKPNATVRRPLVPVPGLDSYPQTELLLKNRSWRYPGEAAGGVFAASVNGVLANSRRLVTEFGR